MFSGGLGQHARALCERVEPHALFVIRAQDLAGLRVHQMRLGARKARHLDVSEVIIFGVIRSPSLDVIASVGAAI